MSPAISLSGHSHGDRPVELADASFARHPPRRLGDRRRIGRGGGSRVGVGGHGPDGDAWLWMWSANAWLALAAALAATGLGRAFRAARIGAAFAAWRAPPAGFGALVGVLVGALAYVGMSMPAALALDATIATPWIRVAGIVIASAAVIGIAGVMGIAAGRLAAARAPAAARGWTIGALALVVSAAIVGGIVAAPAVSQSNWQPTAGFGLVALAVGLAGIGAGRLALASGSAWRVTGALALVVLLSIAPGVGPAGDRAARGHGHAWLHGWQSGAVAEWLDRAAIAAGSNEPETTAGTDVGEVPVRAAGRARARHFVLVSVDTLRADRLPMWGYERDTAPNTAAFFADGVRFDHCYTTAPHSIPAVASLITGRPPGRLPWGGGGRPYPVPERSVTIAELLRSAGFATHHFIYTNYFLSPGTRQGFDYIGTDPYTPGEGKKKPWNLERDGPMAERIAGYIREIATDGRRHFLWLHFIAPHEPYLRHEGAPKWVGRTSEDKYDGEIHYFDRAFAQVIEALVAVGWHETALVALVSDHGETFKAEHGESYHGRTLYQEELRIPCLFRGPGVHERDVATPASLLDVVPTALDWLGLEADLDFPGRSWADVLAGAPAPQGRAVVATRYSVSRMRALEHVVVDGRYKGVFTASGKPVGWFDLRVDPTEGSRRLGEGAQIERLGTALRAWPGAIDFKGR